MAPRATGVWKAAFDAHDGDPPKPPPGVPYSQWAFMLYGPGICGVSPVACANSFCSHRM